ncbi:MAG: pirin family protein [Bacteroidota bacterium]|nr:pirin family protein [Bacteroidota bacterium]
MNRTRRIRKIFTSKPTIEGAGVHLKRAFGFHEEPGFDPFLLLDDFRSNNQKYYINGFPWHPHRGIETITYVLRGNVEHGDSMGNEGIIGSGDVQWMTAGSGIIHQEMPKGDEDGYNWGFQLWANLPASHKMMNPRYRDVKSNQIPEITTATGVKIRIICGGVLGTKGPVGDIVIDPEYLDVTVPAKSEFVHPTKEGHTVFAYVIEGKGYFSEEKKPLTNENLILFDDGNQLIVSAEDDAVRFLLISGKPIGEPVAWHGPIVMNTQEELKIAFKEYNNGTFIRH